MAAVVPPRGSFERFRREMFPDHSPDRNLVQPVADLLEAVARGETKAWILNAPPAVGKSTLTSVLWPAWVHSWDPTARFCFISYEQGIGEALAAQYRTLVTSERYRRLYGDILPQETRIEDIQTIAGGCRFTTTDRARLTSRHFRHVVLDDPHAPGQSEEQGAALFEWFNRTLPSRVVAEDGSIGINQQRLGVTDLTGRVLEADPRGWHLLSLPLRFDPERADPADRRTTPGALLTDRMTPARLARLERQLGRDADAQLQQAPAPADGAGIFRSEWVRHWTPETLPPDRGLDVQSWDFTFKGEARSDYTVGLLARPHGRDLFIVDLVRERADFPRALAMIVAFSARHPGAYTKLVEGKANGPAIISTLQSDVGGFVEVDPRDSKLARASLASRAWEAGRVYLPPVSVPWVPGFLKELLAFGAKGSRNDDQVDAMAQAVNYLLARENSADAMERAMTAFRRTGGEGLGWLNGFRNG